MFRAPANDLGEPLVLTLLRATAGCRAAASCADTGDDDGVDRQTAASGLAGADDDDDAGRGEEAALSETRFIEPTEAGESAAAGEVGAGE